MKTYNVERKLNRFLILGLATSFLIGCGPGFRAAQVGTGLPIGITGSNKGMSDEDMTNHIAKNLPQDPYQNPAPGEKSVAEQILEQENAKKAVKDETLKPQTEPTADPQIAQKAVADEKRTDKPEEKSDGLTVVINSGTAFKELNLDLVKENLKTVKAEVAQYLEGLTVTIRSAGQDKKAVIEVLAVIKRGDAKKERIIADGVISTSVSSTEGKKNQVLETNILVVPSQAAIYSADNLYKPAKNTEVGAICADEKCDSLLVVMRSRGKLNKEPKLFDLALELKRHGQSYQIVGSNASDKPLMTKSFHDAE